jgi:hypothetical protein
MTASDKRVIHNDEEFREYLLELGAEPEDVEDGLEDVDEYLVETAPGDEDLYPFEVEE